MNRDQYLKLRAEWKEEYKALSKEIRDLKLLYKEVQREHAIAMHENSNSNRIWTLQSRLSKIYGSIIFARKNSTKMLLNLDLLKKQAQESYLKEKGN